MMQYRSRLRHAWAEGKCITKLWLVLHHLSGHIKTRKARKCVLSVSLRLGDLSANQMHGTQMNLLTWTGLDSLRQLVAQVSAGHSRRWWGWVAWSGSDGQPDRQQARAPRWPEPEPRVDAGGDRCWATHGWCPPAWPHRVGGCALGVRSRLRPWRTSIRSTMTEIEKWAVTSYCALKCAIAGYCALKCTLRYLKYSFPRIWLANSHLISNNIQYNVVEAHCHVTESTSRD